MGKLEFWGIFGLAIFGLSVILTYTFSILYHSLYHTKANTILKRLDHSSIFLLISGTYTPFILISLKNKGGLMLLLLVWMLTFLGVVYKTVFINNLKRLHVPYYLLLGWLGIFMLGPILKTTSLAVILLLILGGCFYSFGTIFYAWRSLKFNHGIWHLFVLFGTTCHFMALLYL